MSMTCFMSRRPPSTSRTAKENDETGSDIRPDHSGGHHTPPCAGDEADCQKWRQHCSPPDIQQMPERGPAQHPNHRGGCQHRPEPGATRSRRADRPGMERVIIARSVCVDRVLVVCDDDYAGSIRVIESCGGKPETIGPARAGGAVI
jgi:hypothetical protein